MIITNNFSSYPDGTEKVTELLDSIGLIKKDQIIIYIMETDDTYNRKRSSKLIDTLTRKGLIECKNGIIPCIFMISSCVLYKKKYILTEDKYKEICEQLGE